MLLNPITLGWLSIALVIIGIVPYFYLIFRGKVKPHAFSWLVWTMVCAVSFSAEYIDKAGPGAWSTGVACFNCLAVTVIAFFKSEHSISRGDVISLICALLAVPIWYFTHDPLASVIIVTAIDTVGFYPTIRKCYNKPYEEGMFMYFAFGLNYLIALFAIQHWTMVTWLFPACTAFTCFLMVILLVVRRQLVGLELSSRLHEVD